MNNVIPLRLEPDGTEAAPQHELTLESAVLWIRELECRLGRMERTMATIKVICPIAAKVDRSQ